MIANKRLSIEGVYLIQMKKSLDLTKATRMASFSAPIHSRQLKLIPKTLILRSLRKTPLVSKRYSAQLRASPPSTATPWLSNHTSTRKLSRFWESAISKKKRKRCSCASRFSVTFSLKKEINCVAINRPIRTWIWQSQSATWSWGTCLLSKTSSERP